jgi:hypothetical protein
MKGECNQPISLLRRSPARSRKLRRDQVGHFPEAFTHLALISAAINLDRALN